MPQLYRAAVRDGWWRGWGGEGGRPERPGHPSHSGMTHLVEGVWHVGGALPLHKEARVGNWRGETNTARRSLTGDVLG